MKRPVDPDHRTAGDDLHLGAGFVGQRRVLERALPAAQHGNPPSLKGREVEGILRMRADARRKLPREHRGVGKGTNSHRDHHSLDVDRAPVGQSKPVSRPISGQRLNISRIDLQAALLDEPACVAQKEGQGNRLPRMGLDRPDIVVERVAAS